MPIAVDFAWTHPSIATLQANDVALVIRYLTGTGGKAISSAELGSYLAAGIVVVFCYEGTANDAAGGVNAGTAHAMAANAALGALGLPTTVPVYFAVDESITPPSAVPYFQGIAAVRPAATNGCYGEGGLTSLLRSDGLTAWSWQSESTSFPGNAVTLPTANLQQVVNGSPIPGTDLDTICTADVGQWPRPDPDPAPPSPPPVVYPGDTMQATPIDIEIGATGHGWAPSPVPASQVVYVTVLDENPDVVGRFDSVPAFQAAATEAGPNSPNGTLTFTGPGAGTFGAVVWSVS